jgi:hypothetical protein
MISLGILMVIIGSPRRGSKALPRSSKLASTC